MIVTIIHEGDRYEVEGDYVTIDDCYHYIIMPALRAIFGSVADEFEVEDE